MEIEHKRTYFGRVRGKPMQWRWLNGELSACSMTISPDQAIGPLMSLHNYAVIPASEWRGPKTAVTLTRMYGHEWTVEFVVDRITNPSIKTKETDVWRTKLKAFPQN